MEDTDSQEKEKLNKKLDELKKEAADYRKQYEEEWKEYERFYNGDHWRNAKKRPNKNWVFTIIESEIPVLTDSRPGTDCLALDEERTEDAKMLEAGIHAVYDAERLEIKNIQAVRSALITGTGWLYTDYDPDKNNGDGDIILKNINWRQVYIDPKASLMEEAEYSIIEVPTSLEDAKRKFPKYADKFKPSKEMENSFDSSGKDGARNDRWSPELTGNNPRGKYDGDKNTLLEEIWLKDYSMEKIPEEDMIEEIEMENGQLSQGQSPQVSKWENHDIHTGEHTKLKFQLASQLTGLALTEITPEMIEELKQSEEVGLLFTIIDDHIDAHTMMKDVNPKGERPKYSQNLRLVIRFEKEILYDGEAPEKDGIIPLTPIYCYKTADSIYGFGEVKNILHAQKTYNEIDFAELENLRFTSNSGWIVDDVSGVDTDLLTNQPGLVIKKKTGTEVRRVDGGMTNPQLAQRKMGDQKNIQEISGVQEATQGDRPKGVVAAQAIEALQRQSVGRIRLKSRMMESYSMVRLGETVASRIINHWSTEKKLRVYDNGGRIQFIKFDPERVADLKYQIRMVPGTVGGVDKESIYKVMLQLLELGAIDNMTFFEVTDLPYKGTLIDKAVQRDELTQMAQALQAENEQLKMQLGQVVQGMESGQIQVMQPTGAEQANPQGA